MLTVATGIVGFETIDDAVPSDVPEWSWIK